MLFKRFSNLRGAETPHGEHHLAHRIGWLRAAVLGANDGIVSTASLLVGVASAHVTTTQVVLTGVAGLVAGAMSMAAGEYVSVSSQADTERAELDRESRELSRNEAFEREELAAIYEQRGLGKELALEVATQLMQHDALAAHARDELGISEDTAARPVQAALASGATFSLGASLPLLVAWAAPHASLVLLVSVTSLTCLGALGAISARAGGAPVVQATLRVTFWGALAMGLTAAAGILFGAVA
jgi:vacuolar iron transporter family protein